MTDGRYPDGVPSSPGAPDNGTAYGTATYGSGDYPAYDASYGSGGYAVPAYEGTYGSGTYAANGYDSGAWATGGYEASAYTQDAYAGTQDAYAGTQSGYDASGGYAAVAYDGSSGAYATPAYDASYDSGGHPPYNSGAYDTTAYASYDTGAYGQASVPQQASYETAAWSTDTMTAAPDAQPATWSDDPWTAESTGTAWSAPAPDMWHGDNRRSADAFTDSRNGAQTADWYDQPTALQEPADYPAWSAPRTDHEDDPGATQFVTAVDSVSPMVQIDPDNDARTPSTPDEEGTVAFAAIYLDDDTAAGKDDKSGTSNANKEAKSGKAEKAETRAAVLTADAANSRAERRKTTRRSRPLARVAGGSLALVGVAAVAVAAAGGIQAADKQDQADSPVAAGADVPLAASPLDQQFADLRDGAEDFAGRASREQTRIALQERQEDLARQQEEDRKKREAMRPKFVLPVQPGLSAYFGQAGGRWSHLHTGIDFPVDRGTPVRAVTDGVVRTEVNSAYGNMVILTAPDGTETWYCHLTRAKIASGQVKAGDVIAYSGNSGNSTGPHLHLEVRPGGGAPINPIPWLRARGLDPTG
ncbi:peptidoglycan DD-metalloendopeptidase family protein [Uniformispora flossi]|uniref:M23 family metallopeptidase n=1 Tax=Uniformispora flossi TaxID=3390723 RepID=UPI003C2B6D6D